MLHTFRTSQFVTRCTAIIVSSVLVVSASAQGIQSASHALVHVVGQVIGTPNARAYKHNPTAVNPPAIRSRSEDRGVWSPEQKIQRGIAIATRNARFAEGQNAGISILAIQGGGGSNGGYPTNGSGSSSGAYTGKTGNGGYPGSSGGSGGGTTTWGGEGGPSGITNTNTGNKLTVFDLFSWNSRGDVGIDFKVFHNSATTVDSEIGVGWSHTYNMWTDPPNAQRLSTSDTILLHFPDGLILPFTYVSGSYKPLFRQYGRLSTYGLDNFVYTAHNQVKYKFNADGDLISIEDRSGNVVTIARDGNGRPTSATDASSRQLTITYNGNGKIDEVQCPTGREFRFGYSNADSDGANELTTLTEASTSNTTKSYTFEYTSTSDNLSSITDRLGFEWEFEYSGDKLTKERYPRASGSSINNETTYTYTTGETLITLPGGQEWTHYYSNGYLAQVEDPGGFFHGWDYNSYGDPIFFFPDLSEGNYFTYTWDSAGNVTKVEDDLGVDLVTNTYNSSNDLLTSTDAEGVKVDYTRNSAGKITEVKKSHPTTANTLVSVATAAYNTYGQITWVKDALNRQTDYTYEGDGDLDTVDSPANGLTSYNYDSIGRVTSVTNELSNTTTIEYDEWGRPDRLVHPGNTDDIEVAYDSEDQVTTVYDERGEDTLYEYNPAGDLVEMINANGDVEEYTYNANRWRVTTKNGRGYTRTYTYAPRGELWKLELPDGSLEQWTHDAKGRVAKYTSPLASPNAYDIDYEYNFVGDLTKIDYDTGTDTTFTYDDAGRRLTMVDASGTTTWEYFLDGALKELDTPQGNIEYTYTADGMRDTMVQTGTGTTDYTYSSGTGLLTSIVNPFSETTSFTYDAMGRLTKETKHSGVYTDYGYDSRNRLTSVTHKNSSNSTLSSESYTWDAASRMTQRVKDSVTTTFGYDSLGQLTSESRSGYSASYTYDGNGNRLTRTVNSVTEDYTYDNGDKLEHVKIGGVTQKSYTYDAAGRTKTVVSGAGTTSLTYDFESRITRIDYPNSTYDSYSYNGLDTRISKVENGTSRTFMRDGTSPVAPVLTDGAATYTPGISERRSSTTTYLQHGLKNAEAQTGSGQTITASREHDAFGNVLSSSGTWNGPFGYAGGFGYQEDASGLKLLGHRYYDSSIGRFLTRDPIKDGRNWFAYGGGAFAPTAGADPSGLAIVFQTHEDLFFAPPGAGSTIAGNAQNIVNTVGSYIEKHDVPEPWNGPTHNKNNDCGFFVGNCVCPVDPDFPPRGTGKQYPYINDSDLWEKVDPRGYKPKPGDVYIRPPGNSYGHIEVAGDTGNYGASYGDHPPKFKPGRGGKPGPFPGSSIFRIRERRLSSSELVVGIR